MISNLNFSSHQIKASVVSNRAVATPSFRGNLPSDRFEKSAIEGLTPTEQLILDVLNAKRAKGDEIVLSKETLAQVEAAFLTRETRVPYDRLNLGDKAATQAIRTHLIENAGNKNTFQLTLIQDMVYTSLRDIAKSSGFSGLFRQDSLQMLVPDFKKFLGILHLSEGQDTVNRFLAPYIAEEAQTTDARKLMRLIKEYFSQHEKANRNVDFLFTKRDDGQTTVRIVVDGQLRTLQSKPTRDHAIAKAIRRVLDREGLTLRAEKRNLHAGPVRYTGNKAATDEAVSMLRDMFFFSPKETLDMYKDAALIEHLTYARTPSMNVSNTMNFQLLEYLGDSVANTYAARFIAKKGLEKEVSDNLCCEMISNTTYRRFAKTVNLPKHLNTLSNEYANKISADMFEAVIGVLHLHFPKERVYAYLSRLFEAKYQEFMSTITKTVL